ncbi:MAG: hypothetical protein QXT81_02305 [Candidatus Bathyarchaeia archaeon]
MEAGREDAIITAKDVMSKPVVTVRDDENAARAAQLMETGRDHNRKRPVDKGGR